MRRRRPTQPRLEYTFNIPTGYLTLVPGPPQRTANFSSPMLVLSSRRESTVNTARAPNFFDCGPRLWRPTHAHVRSPPAHRACFSSAHTRRAPPASRSIYTCANVDLLGPPHPSSGCAELPRIRLTPYGRSIFCHPTSLLCATWTAHRVSCPPSSLSAPVFPHAKAYLLCLRRPLRRVINFILQARVVKIIQFSSLGAVAWIRVDYSA